MSDHKIERFCYKSRLPSELLLLCMCLALYGCKYSNAQEPKQVEFDYVKIVRNPLPEQVVNKMKQLPELIKLSDKMLEILFVSSEQSFIITDKRTRRQWKSCCTKQKAVLTAAEKKNDREMLLSFWDTSTKVEYLCTASLIAGGILALEIDAEKYDSPFCCMNTFPPRLQTDFKNGKLIFCNRSSGMYIDQTDDYKDWKEMKVYGNLSMDMPWIGVLDEKTGEGLMVLVETPADAMIVLEKDAQKRNWPQVLWLQSMDSFRYPRRLSYRFSPSGGYVSLAKMYRNYAEQTGKLVTLEQKAKRKPNVNLLKGAPMIWGCVDAWDFVRQARARGIVSGVISNTHRGLRDNRTLRKINELGYITTEYENVSDILEGKTGALTDHIEDAAYHYSPGLGPASGWHAEGGPQYSSRSSSKAVRAMKMYVPGRLRKFGYNGRFVDVSAALDLFEDYHPEHTFDRRQDMLYRREVFKYLDNFGLVVGTEHGNDWVNDLVEYAEGAAGGPLWWKGGWNAGELKKPTSRNQFNKAYLKYGMGYDVSIPLWQLVYHDCVISTWYWGDGAGFMYDAAPELSDRKDLFNILYGAVPIFWRDDWGYDWKKNRSRFLQTYHEVCKMNEAIAFDCLLNHEFLSEDKTLQKTKFSSGTICVVNFGETPKVYQIDDKRDIMLAPRGYYVKGPGIYQTKEWKNGEAVTKIEAEGYLRVQCASKRKSGPVELSGTLTAFEYEKDRWHILLENTKECVIDLQMLAGVSPGKSYYIYDLDSMGNLTKRSDYREIMGQISLQPQQPEAMYAVLFNVKPEDILIAPAKEDIDSKESIELSVTDSNLDIRYTIDGKEPTAESMKYTKPFHIQAGSVIKARAFQKDGTPTGSIVEKAYRVVDLVYESGTIRGGQPVQTVDVNMTGFKGLILSIDQDGTVVFWDYVDWADARLSKQEGDAVYLSSMKPSLVLHDHYRLGIDERARDLLDREDSKLPLQLGGQVYDKGLGMVSPAKIEYLFDKQYTRFQSKLGIDDSMKDKGQVIVRVYGIR